MRDILRSVTRRVQRPDRHRADGTGDAPDEARLALGRVEARSARVARYDRLAEAEFRVFSQFGEDGIIQYLLGRVPIENDQFIEIGVQDYRESNTRFLLCNDNWRGLILDGGSAHIDFIRSNSIGWRHAIDARTAFITRDNVNEVIADAGLSGDIGLLSIDIDGNDYWVLEAVDIVSPRILIVEYNSTFGPNATVTVPYDPAFNRTIAHASGLYWGASLAAICHVAERKGFAFVGSNSAGNNAFYVRGDLLRDLQRLEASEGWVDARFRESRDSDGRLSYVDGRRARVDVIGSLPLIDVVTGEETTVWRSIKSEASDDPAAPSA